MTINVNNLRHPKESLYFTIAAVGGGLVWLIILLNASIFGMLFLGLLVVAILWIAQQMLQAKILGNAVKVSENQFPEIFHAAEDSIKLNGWVDTPEIYIVNADGMINAFALKVFSRKYTILASSLVDLMYKEDNLDVIKFVMAHEMAHHAAGHTSILKNLLVKPAMLIPFLGSAYSRACEMTCDAIATNIVANKAASTRALVLLALGSEKLSEKVSTEAFTGQESEMPNFFTYLNEILSSHPRLTRRVLLVNKMSPKESVETVRTEELS